MELDKDTLYDRYVNIVIYVTKNDNFNWKKKKLVHV